jgi:hypothetical protein
VRSGERVGLVDEAGYKGMGSAFLSLMASLGLFLRVLFAQL